MITLKKAGSKTKNEIGNPKNVVHEGSPSWTAYGLTQKTKLGPLLDIVKVPDIGNDGC
jgi:hypothetical protein